MAKISLINILIGFITVFFFACYGVFIVNDITNQQIQHGLLKETWQSILQTSSHGHGNLFGFQHILIGLTMPYSRLSNKIKIAQTFGLTAGTLAMGAGLYFKSFSLPNPMPSGIDIIIGICLGCSLISLLTHCLGLLFKILAKE